MSESNSSLGTQIGGDHYKGMKIQPIEYIVENEIPFVEGAVIKYVSRWKKKGGVDDLRKARHMLDMLIEMELENLEESVTQTWCGAPTPPADPSHQDFNLEYWTQYLRSLGFIVVDG